MATNTTNFNLIKPAYTDTADIADINGNMDKVDVSLNGLADAIAIVANNNTHVAITAGQYVYVHGHGSLAEGLYTARSNIAADATLSTSNLQADGSGGLNALNSNIVAQAYGDWKSAPIGYTKSYKYEGENTSDYDIPNSYVIVTVTKQSINRGVAIAQRWDTTQMWINRLHDTWKGWTEIALKNDITTWDTFSISVSSRITAGYSLSCRKNDTLKLCAISFSGVLNTATAAGNALMQIDPALQPVPKKMMSFLLWNGNQSKTHSVTLDPTNGIIAAGEAIPAPINIAFDILFSYS